MEIQFILNGKMQTAVIAADTLLLDLLRSLGNGAAKPLTAVFAPYG